MRDSRPITFGLYLGRLEACQRLARVRIALHSGAEHLPSLAPVHKAYRRVCSSRRYIPVPENRRRRSTIPMA